MTSPANCRTCKHVNLNNLTCTAFPRGIPLNIISGDTPHTSVFPQQVGTDVYTPQPIAPKVELPVISNKAKFASATFYHPDDWKIIGSQGSMNLVLLGKDDSTGDLIVGKTTEGEPKVASDYTALSLASLMKFSQGDVQVSAEALKK